MNAPLLEVHDLIVEYPGRRHLLGHRESPVRALDRVSLAIARGETLGLVGESGAGKSTLGRAILRLVRPTTGSITFLGRSLTDATPTVIRQLRPQMQVVFQNPYSSLNPALRVVEIIGEPLAFHGGLRGPGLIAAVDHLLERVGISPELREQFPHQFSGGQRQRIAIARAIALEPKLIICDEATSGLDVSTRNQIIGLLEDLRDQLGIAYLFIGHDLALVRHISHRIAVMYRGQIVETGDVEQVCDHPTHPYTERLISAIPVPDPQEQASRRSLRVSPCARPPRRTAVRRVEWDAASGADRVTYHVKLDWSEIESTM